MKKIWTLKIIVFVSIILATGLIYYFSNSLPQDHFDYTFRVAENMLRGKIAFSDTPPSWLNEFVYFNGGYYSVFPLGSVLSMIPFALFKVIGLIDKMPSQFVVSIISIIICIFLLLIADSYEHLLKKKILIVSGILFGTWMWANLVMGGAWQIALGFAVVGQLGAIYFSIFNRKPILAGLFFAVAFGNRTEILLIAQIFMYLLLKNPSNSDDNNEFKFEWKTIAEFCLIPFILGVSTLIYNYLRFNSFTDFGYSRIPGVLNEPWYKYGIFSIYYIPLNVKEMLFTTWKQIAEFPYYVPTGFGGSILMSSPFILLTLKFGSKNKAIKYSAWLAIIILTILLWIHGNPGGWQFSYRYAMILIPWIFLILLENSSEKIKWYEYLLYGISILINFYAVYLFFWTDYVKL